MCRKLICSFSFALMLSLVLTSAAKAEMVGWWRLNEGSGTTAIDSSGNNNNGTLQGDPQWVTGIAGSALEFDGTDDYVSVPSSSSLQLTSALTMAGWIKADSWGSGTDVDIIARKGEDNPNNYQLSIADGLATLYLDDGDGAGHRGDTLLNTGQWYHIAATWDGTTVRVYVDGVLDNDPPDSREGNINVDTRAFYIGGRAGTDLLDGILDDIRLFSEALPAGHIQSIMQGGGATYPFAHGCDPADGALHADTWISLSWRPGDCAVSHDVYLGDNLSDVNEATRDSDVFRGNQTATFYVAGFPGFAYPEGLLPGTTYYWRIDEVNDADPNSPWKGPVWSFSIPPKTAYFPDPPDGAGFVGPDNVTLSWTPGFGAKLHTVYFGEDYDEVNNATVGVPSGMATYSPGPLEREKVYYWRVDEFDGAGTYKGDVWSFTTPGAVGNPQPAYDATDVQLNVILSWTPADNAASHELYFGTDKEVVRNADTGSPEYKGSKALGSESYDPGLLEPDTAYYWRVDEVDDQGNTAKGPLWIFTTGAFLLVDDFESYTDDDVAGQAIWQHWIDGFGVPDNGSQVGNLLPPYAEQAIVHGGSQSMPLSYVNEAGVTNSEASKTLTAPKDWTQAGVAELSLWFRGASDNAEDPPYVAVSNSAGAPAVVAYDNSEAALARGWTHWIIPLQAFADQGIILTNVDKIAIGLGSKSGMAVVGGSGTIYIDDIRLNQ